MKNQAIKTKRCEAHLASDMRYFSRWPHRTHRVRNLNLRDFYLGIETKTIFMLPKEWNWYMCVFNKPIHLIARPTPALVNGGKKALKKELARCEKKCGDRFGYDHPQILSFEEAMVFLDRLNGVKT